MRLLVLKALEMTTCAMQEDCNNERDRTLRTNKAVMNKASEKQFGNSSLIVK
jgi:hypothetical protein